MLNGNPFRKNAPSDNNQQINIDIEHTYHMPSWGVILWVLVTIALIGLIVWLNMNGDGTPVCIPEK